MPQTRDFDVDQISVFIDGEREADLESVGWDDSADHEHTRTMGDDGNIWVIVDEEVEATVAVKAVSQSIPRLERAYKNAETVSLAVQYADAEPRVESNFLDGKFLGFGPADDYENDSMPMYEGSLQFDRVEHEYDE
ncbi:hypothetical protein [Halanaeroarchaeum sulfurireducens]|uniref:hypothetical protein n=1 Tax=Halanaeroarchaeum sulfurireducens TaxID=1604004 RepID=UPI0006C91E0A|nr:hypothetical protein [Halanaeroarchaeum sulfurireducens]